MKTPKSKARLYVLALGMLIYMPLATHADSLTVEGDLNVQGKVGIGTDTPTAKLEVAGNVKVTGDMTVSGNVLMGAAEEASGVMSIAMGFGAKAIGDSSIAMGVGTRANFQSSIALGQSTNADGLASTSTGMFTSAVGYASFSAGEETGAQSHSSFVIGRRNVMQGDPWTWVPTDDLFVIGNDDTIELGSGGSNAFAVHKNGNVRAAGTVQSKGGFRTPPMGDLSMGTFTAGPTPTGYSETAGSNPADLNAGLRYDGE